MSENISINDKMIISNVVREEEMRNIQSRTLNILRKCLSKSFGPYGSNTTITKSSGELLGAIQFTKDGHNILKNIRFKDVIETAVRDSVEEITRNIVVKVGDGTTSAVILSSIIFDNLIKLESELTPYQIIEDFKKNVSKVSEVIKSHTKEFTPETAYKIAYTATNGNEEVALNLKNIYEEYGSDVYIDVSISPNEDNILKSYDGITLETGFADAAYINTSKGASEIHSPEVYVFEDPIDTPQMGKLFDKIINDNIIEAFHAKNMDAMVPTVIMTTKISRDYAAFMEQVAKFMYSIDDPTLRPPLLIISHIKDEDVMDDIGKLCGAKNIRKYIDPQLYKKDVEAGLAADETNIKSFAGSAELVSADNSRTKFINPKKMYKEGTNEFTDTFNSLVTFLESELERSKNDTNSAGARTRLKKRIQALKSNLVEYLVGGISVSDRDSLRDLVEDAVKNCRSAAQHGTGFGANYEGLRASHVLLGEDPDNKMLKIIFDSYIETIDTLYDISGITEENSYIINGSLDKGMPYDVKNKEFNDDVITSIMSDVVILEAISKIMTLMVTTNQFLTPDFMHNNYVQNLK